MNPENLPELRELQTRLGDTLKTFVSDAGLELLWRQLEELDIPMPKADVRLVEDGYSSAVGRSGHGLQRAFILSALQHLAFASTAGDQESPGESVESAVLGPTPNLVLAIKEPELYQHPNRQRHFAKVLQRLACGEVPGVAERTQVIYGTHSPLFVGLDRTAQLRLFRKNRESRTEPKTTSVASTNLDSVADTLWVANGSPEPRYEESTVLPRLAAIMTPWMNEGFFAEVVVLVEGEDDRAAILGTADVLSCDLESEGIAVIPCGGKDNLDRPAVIFGQLGIPTYVVWDNDRGNNKKTESNSRQKNRYLLRLLGEKETDWPCCVTDAYACFEGRLEDVLDREFGRAVFQECIAGCMEEYGFADKSQAQKSPRALASMINRAAASGCRSHTLESIVDRVLAMKGQPGATS